MRDLEPFDRETDEQLTGRHAAITELARIGLKKFHRRKPGPNRDRLARLIGDMEFNRLHCETEMKERGLPILDLEFKGTNR